jgi:putative hydrolase of the HAD superfamily
VILVLDLDGVVVTGHADGGRWDKHLARDLNLRPELLQEHFFKPLWKSVLVGDAGLHETLAHIWPELQCETGPQDFIDYWFAADSAVDHDVVALVGAWRQRGGKCFLATNQEHCRAAYLWATLGLSTRFDGQLYSADLGAAKPDSRFFARVVERLGVAEPSEIRFLDDALANVEAAAAAGWDARHYRGIDDLRHAIEDVSTKG